MEEEKSTIHVAFYASDKRWAKETDFKVGKFCREALRNERKKQSGEHKAEKTEWEAREAERLTDEALIAGHLKALKEEHDELHREVRFLIQQDYIKNAPLLRSYTMGTKAKFGTKEYYEYSIAKCNWFLEQAKV